MKQRNFKIVSLLLIISMFMSCLPAGIFALESSDEDNAYILSEDISKRGENEKHFVMSDGSMMAVKYDEAVHYMIDGEWKEVDNSLSYDSVGKKYINKNNSAFSVEFPENGRVSITSDEGYTMSFSTSVTKGLQNIELNSSAAKMIASSSWADANSYSNNKKYAKDPESFAVHNLGSELEYQDAYGNGTSVKYGVTHNSVKEDVILESNVGITSFVTEYYTDLNGVKLEDGSILFVDRKGNEIFTVGAPYMYDSEGAVCESIEVSIDEISTGYRAVYTPDSTWLNSSERVYPLVFDPNVATYSYSSASKLETQGYIRCVSNVNENSSLSVGYEYDPSYSGNDAYRYYRTYYKPIEYPKIDLAFNEIKDITINFKVQEATASGTLKVYKLDSSSGSTQVNYTLPTYEPLSTISYNTSTTSVDVPVDISDYNVFYNTGYDTEATSNSLYGYIITDSEVSSGYGGTSSGDNRRISFYGAPPSVVSKKPVMRIKYVAKDLDGRYVYINQYDTTIEEENGSSTTVYNYHSLCIDDTGVCMVTNSTEKAPNENYVNPAGLTNPVKSIWKFTLLESGVYVISPANDLTKYLMCNSSGALSLGSDATSGWAQWNISINSTTGKMAIYNVQNSFALAKSSSEILVDVNLYYSTNTWDVFDAYSIKGEISDKREYILYNPVIGKALQFTNGTTNTVGFGDFNARTEIVTQAYNLSNKPYGLVSNSPTIQRIQLIKPVGAENNEYYIKPFLNGAYSEKYLSISETGLEVSGTPTLWTVTQNANGKYSISSGTSNLGTNMSNTTPIASDTAVNTLWNLDCVGLLVNKRAQMTETSCGAASTTMMLEYHGWTEDYNNDNKFDENDIKLYMQDNGLSYGSYSNCSDALNSILCDEGESNIYGYCGYNDYSNIMPDAVKFEEYVITIADSFAYNCPVLTCIGNEGTGGVVDVNMVIESNSSLGHIVVIKGIYYDYYSCQYNAVISDPNYRYQNSSFVWLGFDNSLPAIELYNYTVAHPVQIMQITLAKEAIYYFGYKKSDYIN